MDTHREFIFYNIISYINLVCGDKIMKEIPLTSKLKHAEREYKRRNTEDGFLKFRIFHLFTPSVIKSRNLAPDCSKEDIINHFNDYVAKHGRNCFYCKEPWTYIFNRYNVGSGKKMPKGKKREHIKNFSIDRLDSSKTYSIDNIVFCCQQCNLSKKDISISMIKRLYEIITERNL